MIICQITSMHDWDDDRIYQRACLGLARNGHEVHLVSERPKKIPLNNQIIFHWIEPRTGAKRRWFSSKEAIEKAIKIKADVYHFHDPDLLPHVLKLKRKIPNSNVIYDIHENYAGRFKNWGLPSFLGFFFRIYEKSRMSKMDGFTVVSSSMKSLFNSVNKPSIIIRNSTDIHRLSNLEFNNNEKPDHQIIYTSGTNSHARNCLQTVKSLKYINLHNINFKMLFVGRYEEGIKEEMYEQAKIDTKEYLLEIEGMLPWEDNFVRTTKAFCGCVFYEDNPNNRVGIPNRLFEYMYCELPVVATNFPELRKIVEDTKCGILVDSEDPESIAKAFTFLLKNPIKAKKMGQRGKKAIETQYGYHVDLKNMIEFYKSLMN